MTQPQELPHKQHARRPGRFETLVQWALLGTLVGVACGLGSAVFLFLLGEATTYRIAHPRLVGMLPVAGLLIGAFYARWGESIRGGNNLVLDTLHDNAPELPFRMAPMVLVGTVVTHLFGGSVGREGTAVQMGASLADAIAHRVRARPELRRQLLAAGISGGFGSVFGTPIAGALFGLEVVCVGRMEYDALLPALIAATVGDLVTRGVGVTHTQYPRAAACGVTPVLLAKWLVFGVAVALTSTAFIEITHRLKHALEQRIPKLAVRMMLGGAAILALRELVGTDDYLGLGIPVILRAFTDPTLSPYAFAAKLVFTAVTLSAGFPGGEVTPLFFIGATLGAVLARALGLPLDLAAGVGLASMFGAAANTPIALSVMAIELLGENLLPHVVIVMVVAYIVSGHRGIYPAQRIARHKRDGSRFQRVAALRSLHTIDGANATDPPASG